MGAGTAGVSDREIEVKITSAVFEPRLYALEIVVRPMPKSRVWHRAGDGRELGKERG